MDQSIKLLRSFSLPNFERKNHLLPIVSIATAISVVYACYKSFAPNKERKDIRSIPVPGSAYPFIGHLLSLDELPGKTVTAWHKELGPIIKLKMGVRNWIMVNDHTLAHKILVTHGAETSYRDYNTYNYKHYGMGGKGVAFSQPDERWKVSRSAALNLLAPKHIEKITSKIERHSQDLVNRLIEFSERENGIDPLPYFKLFALNVVFETVFSKRFGSIEDPEFLMLERLVEFNVKHSASENDLSSFLPILSIYQYFFGHEAEEIDHVANERNPYFRKIINEAAVAEGTNFIKSLTEHGYSLTEDEIIVMTNDFTVAGTDTVSVSLGWNIAILCHRPDVQDKVIAEIDEFIKLNGRLPTFKERARLPYCICVIKESMRLKSITTFGLAHSLREDLYVDGYLIPSGSVIFSSMESMHMQPGLYPDPEKFKPERFMNNLKTMQSAANGRLKDRDHFNFGWGRRSCPGIYLSESELFYAFVQIFARCRVEPTSDGLPDIDNAQHIGLTTAPIPYRVKFIQRADSLYGSTK